MALVLPCALLGGHTRLVSDTNGVSQKRTIAWDVTRHVPFSVLYLFLQSQATIQDDVLPRHGLAQGESFDLIRNVLYMSSVSVVSLFYHGTSHLYRRQPLELAVLRRLVDLTLRELLAPLREH